MNPSQKLGTLFIALITSIFGFFSGFLLGGLSEIVLIIGIMPLILGRLFFGKSFLNYLEPIYATTILLQAVLTLPAEIFPDVYLQLFLYLFEIFFNISENGGVIGTLDAALTYEIILGYLLVFAVAYLYREDYFSNLRKRL